MKTRCLLWLLSLFACAAPAPAGPENPGPKVQPIQETVTVQGVVDPASAGDAAKETVVIDREFIDSVGALTVGDVLRYVAQVDLTPRTPGGFGGDVQMRGSSYAGVLVCVDGLRWNDAQTAHFNTEIPVPLSRVERIEVVPGSHAVLFGADAVGGVINIVTKKDWVTGASAETWGGSFGNRSAALDASVSSGPAGAAVACRTDVSDGFAPNRDYDVRTLYANGGSAFGWGRASVSGMRQENRFGAQGFYGNYPSWEDTAVSALAGSVTLNDPGLFPGPLTVSVLRKEHDDHFVLYRNNPSLYENRHTTVNSLVRAVSSPLRGDSWTVAVVGEFSDSSIVSPRLGNHERRQGGLAAQAEWRPAEGVELEAGLRLDSYTDWGCRALPALGLAWQLRDDLRLRAAAGTAFRVPSFTELYYSSPAQIGNPNLVPEKSVSVEGGFDWALRPDLLVQTTVYARRERDVIDWVRWHSTDPWQAENIGRLNCLGASASLESRPAAGLRLWGSYAWTDVSAEEGGFESRYALDCLRHGVDAAACLEPGRGLSVTAALQGKVRASGRRYLTMSARLAWNWKALTLAAEGENLFDARIEEIQGVPMPGIGFRVGLRVRLDRAGQVSSPSR